MLRADFLRVGVGALTGLALGLGGDDWLWERERYRLGREIEMRVLDKRGEVLYSKQIPCRVEGDAVYTTPGVVAEFWCTGSPVTIMDITFENPWGGDPVPMKTRWGYPAPVRLAYLDSVTINVGTDGVLLRGTHA